MPERDLQEQVRVLARGLGLAYFHPHVSLHSPAGFLDCVIVGARGVLYRELKRQGKSPTPVQQVWIDALIAAGCDAAVWRPSDLLSGVIVAQMRALGPLPPQQVAVLRPSRR